MSIKIQNESQSITILESTSVIESGENLPRIMFGRKGYNIITRPRWQRNRANQREGNFAFYNGSDDKIGPVTMYLSGATRNANLETLKTLAEVIYLDIDDINSFDSGKYTCVIQSIERDEDAQIITVVLNMEAYNN